MRFDTSKHQLGPPEHLEGVVSADVAPGEIDESVASLALDGRSAEVEKAADPGDDDVDLPQRIGYVGSEQLRWIALQLNSDMDVVH